MFKRKEKKRKEEEEEEEEATVNRSPFLPRTNHNDNSFSLP
jgi:hypothetical protein